MPVSCEFTNLWAQLKAELNLCDEDLNVGYRVVIFEDGKVIGHLKAGRCQMVARYYPHPSNARVQAERYEKRNPTHKTAIKKWNDDDVETWPLNLNRHPYDGIMRKI